MARELGHILMGADMFDTVEMEGHGKLHEVSRQAADDELQARKRQANVAQPAKLAKRMKTETVEPVTCKQQALNVKTEISEPVTCKQERLNVKTEMAEPVICKHVPNSEMVCRKWRAGALKMNGPTAYTYIKGWVIE